MSEPYVQAWEDELPEHPVIAELRAQPGRWATLGPLDEPDWKAWTACNRHSRVQTRGGLSPSGTGVVPPPRQARWIPDEEWRCGRCDA